MPEEQEERRTHARGRRDEDQSTIGELTLRLKKLEELREQDLSLHKQAMDVVLTELKAIRAQNETQLEMMTAWNSAKGFVKTVQTVGGALLWVGKVSAVIAAFWVAFIAAVKYGGGR